MRTIYFFTKGDRTVASSRYRAYGVGEALQASGNFLCQFFSIKNPIPYTRLIMSIRATDVVLLQRPTFAPKLFFLFLAILKITRRPLIIFDLDDYQPQYSRRRVKFLIKLSDKAIVGSAYLAEYMIRRMQNVEIIPTVVPFDQYHAYTKKEYRVHPPLTIGWIGDAPAHRENLQLLDPIFRRLQREGTLFQFMLIGSKNDAAITQMFSFLGDKYIHIPSLPWDDIATTAMHISNFDIGIMPLKDNPWNRSKCSFKAIECMACGVPVVVSAVGENIQLVRHNKNGMLASTDEEWVLALQQLMANPALREHMGKEGAKTVVQNYSLQSVLQKYLKILI